MSGGYIQYFTAVVLVTFIINTVFDPGARVNFWTFEVSVKIFSNMSPSLDTHITTASNIERRSNVVAVMEGGALFDAGIGKLLLHLK